MNTPVGFIVSWKVPATVQVKLLRDSLTAAGLDAGELAPDLKPLQLVARTAGFIAKLTSQPDARRLARPVNHTSRQITREEVVADDLTYTREASIKLDEHTHQVVCDEPTIAAMLPSTTSEVYDTRTASDVTRIIQAIVSACGSDLIPVREQGGAYFIPQGQGIITQLHTVLDGIGGELTTFACTLGHGSDESIANTITDYLLKQVGELQESIDELNEAGIRSDVKNRRLSRVADLRERVGAYATLIQAGGQQLKLALDKAEDSLLAKLGKSDDDATIPPATPAAEPIAA